MLKFEQPRIRIVIDCSTDTYEKTLLAIKEAMERVRHLEWTDSKPVPQQLLSLDAVEDLTLS